MIFRQLNDQGDWTFGKGANNFARLQNAVALNVRTRILSWFRDCFFAEQDGIAWGTRLDISTDQRTLLEADLRRIISQTPDVTAINSFDSFLDRETRRFVANYDIQTVYSASYQDEIERFI